MDGLAACSAGVFVLAFRVFLASLYALPLDLLTVIGLVNIGYSAYALTLAARTRRKVGHIVALSAANYLWACVCLSLAVRFALSATTFGLAHLLFEGAFVAALATIEWQQRRALATGAHGAART